MPTHQPTQHTANLEGGPLAAGAALRQELLETLTPFGQEHVLAHWDRLNEPQRRALAAQIRAIDLAEMRRLHDSPATSEDWHALAARSVGPPAVRLNDRRSVNVVRQARQRGEELLARGQLGVALVAGGQGTRLGFDKPKGMFPIGPVSGRTLFEILAAKVAAIAQRYAVRVPLYLMTSPATHADTLAYFADHDNLGLPSEDLHIFCQGTMPAVDMSTGKLLMADAGQLATSPDGHGGMLAAIARSGLLDDMSRRGLTQLFYLQVDNPLTPIGDAELLGHHLQAGSQMTTLAVAKQRPLERVGNVVSVDGQVRIIEYSDLPDEEAQRLTDGGALALWAGNTAIHLFEVDFLRRMSVADHALPFHVARKKVPYFTVDGVVAEPEAPNAVKFERFIFDLLPHAARALVIEAAAEEVFAPVKNASGEPRDTPETVRQQMIALYTTWLAQAGVEVAAGTPVEISPRFALDADELRRKLTSREPVRAARYFGV